MKNTVARVLSALAGAWLAGCSSIGSGVGPNPHVDVAAEARASNDSLYVANARTITVYDPQNGALLRTISTIDPRAIAFDRNGKLFVANERENKVTVYARGKATVLRVISDGLDAPNALAFDDSENLYVSNSHNKSVTVYAPGSGSVLRTITDGIVGPHDLLFNKRGDLFVGNNGSGHITVYPPGKIHPIRTIVTHNGPLALVFNRVSDLFCVNNFNVTVYKPGKTQPTRTITDGVSVPSTLVMGGSGNIYLANWGGNVFRSNISIYPPKSSSPSRVIRKGIGYPLSMVFDAAGNLYVANSAYNTVTEYGPGSSKIKRTFRAKIQSPTAVSFGP